MTLDDAPQILALLAKLNRTIDQQQQQIDSLIAQVAAVTEKEG